MNTCSQSKLSHRRSSYRNILMTIAMSSTAIVTQAQDTYLPLNSDEYHWVDKAESKINQLLPFTTTLKPLSRRHAVMILSEYKEMRQLQMNTSLDDMDRYQLDRLLSKNIEWTQPNLEGEYGVRSNKPLLKYFYHTPANFYHYEDDNLFLVFNPVLYTQVGYEKGMSKYPSILSRGAEMRARLWNKIGVYTIISEHQERMPSYGAAVASRWHRAFPGHDYFSASPQKLYDAMIGRGYVDISLYRENVKLTVGYDKHFLGDGIRSLWLSDQGAPYSFARINYNFGRWQYQNLFMELNHDYYGALDSRIPAKYASMHYLTTRLGNKWQLGLFESTIFNTSDQFTPLVLQPIIGVNTALQSPGSHKSAMGINVKGLLYPGLVFYGQSYVNSLDFATLKNGGWKNQYALQGGIKYYDAFTIPRLDLQVEYNAVRPFTYAGLESNNTTYSHWNQPLAHALENSFYEAIAHVKYNPIPRVWIDARMVYAQKSIDTYSINSGITIFQPLHTRSGDNGFYINNKNSSQWLLANLNVSFEWRPNIYFDAGGYILSQQNKTAGTKDNIINAYAGIRMNMTRRLYDWF